MLNQTLFKRAFWFLVLTAALNWIAIKLYLYWTVWWIDTIVHFFGGLTVAFGIFWLYSKLRDLKQEKLKKLFMIALFGALFVGVSWELFELFAGITSLSDGAYYFANTSSDLIMDMVGGIAGFFSVRQLLKKYE